MVRQNIFFKNANYICTDQISFFLENTSKPYTPVCYSMTGKLPPAKIPSSLQLVWFVIKTYSDGKVTKLLDKIPVAQSFEGQMKYTLKLGFPQGIFDQVRMDSNIYKRIFPIIVCFSFSAVINLYIFFRAFCCQPNLWY